MGLTMIIRTLVLALSCAWAAAGGAPALVAHGDDECALYLTGPARSSAYDYSLNLLRGNFGYQGQHSCITYEAINQAYHEARQRIVVAQPKGEWKPEDFASVGELILDISINLAKTYGLTYEEIEKGLPLIDTSRTLISEVCPPVFSHVECRAGKYRRLDGLCNNLQHPTWGATNAPFQRLIGPLFADGINAPRISHTGRDLPLSRVVSRTMHPDEGFHDHAGTVMVIAWGQFMDHDYTLTGTPLDPINRNDPEECCKRPPHLKHPYCNEIRIPDDDYFYRLFGVKCIDFVRGFPSPRPGCRLGSRVPFNTLTGAIDGNTVYGVSDKFARKLRTGYGGLLRMNPVFKEYGLKDLLPLKLDIPDEGCTRPNKNMYCFEAGEIRVNEQLVLTVMHTLMAREHNRVANGLAAVNPHWDDETLYQEARRINIAEIQHITYNEFLPILLGKDVMEKFGLVLEKKGYWDGFDPSVNPDVIDAFAAAAYRFGHSLLPTAVERWSKAHKFIASKRLSDLIRRPYDLYRAGVLDEYVMGLMNQVAQAMDDSITQEVTNHLFKKIGARFGMDLVSFNMQRGREFGLPGYMEFRKFCGLSGADTFQDLFGSMSNDTIRKYESIFEHPIDVDLWSGGVSERPLPGSMLGPTFACVIATQFSYSRRGDRFWFELPHQPSSFTPEQLAEIRKSRLARVICDNTDIIDTVQLYPMVLPDHELNPRVPCRSGILPSMDFSKWAEPAPAPFHSGAKSFITEVYITSKNDTVVDSDQNSNITDTELVKYDSLASNEDSFNSTAEDKMVEQINLQIKTELLKEDQENETKHTQFVVPHNCTKENTNCQDESTTETVLTQLYKNEDASSTQKSTGHPKNNIHRKKRNLNNYVDNLVYSASAPVIVDYKTYHHPGHREPLSLPNPIIDGAQLADFSIQTTHDSQPRRNIDETENSSNDYSPKPLSDSKERDSYKDDNEKKPHRKYTDSSENDRSHRRRYNEDSHNESGENSDEREKYRKQESSNENEGEVNNGYREGDKSEEISQYTDKKGKKSSEESGEYDGKRDYTRDDRDRSDKRSNYNDRKVPNYQNDDYLEGEKSEEKSQYTDKKGKKSSEETSAYDSKDSRERSEEQSEYNDRNAPNDKEDYDSVEKNDDRPNARQRGDDSHDYNTKKIRNSESDESDEEDREGPPSRSHENYSSSERDYAPPRHSKHRGNSRDHSSTDSKEAFTRPLKESEESRENGPHPKSITESVKNKPRRYNDSESDFPKLGYKDTNSDESEESYNNKAKPVLESYYDNGRKSTPEREDENDEEAIVIMTKKNRNKYKDPKGFSNGNLPPKIQDVNLDEFSYESLKKRINDKGNVKPSRYSHKNIIDVNIHHLPLTTRKPELSFVNNHAAKFAQTLETGTPLVAQIIESVRRPIENPIHLNDGEVRPVVELHGDKDESREENVKAPLKADDEDQSLETLLGVGESLVQTGKIVEESVETENGDLKQQFERIPLDYNHKENHNHKTKENDPKTLEPVNENLPFHASVIEANDALPVQPTDATPDIATPPIKYDENLGIKFDDTPLKLPEIKLPDDILSYVYNKPDFIEEKKEPNFYNYGNSFEKEHPRKENLRQPSPDKYNHSNDDEHSEPRYYEKEDYRKPKEEDENDDVEHYYHVPTSYYRNPKEKEDLRKKKAEKDDDDGDEEGVDLYEKFVRERFGLRRHGKRSENYRDARSLIDNPELTSKLRHVLKKAENIDKEAARSGDPNAGYLWTLEYGQNL